MRIADLDGRLVLVRDGEYVDVATVSTNRFGPDPQAVLDHWEEFRAWAERVHVRAVLDELGHIGVAFRPRDRQTVPVQDGVGRIDVVYRGQARKAPGGDRGFG